MSISERLPLPIVRRFVSENGTNIVAKINSRDCSTDTFKDALVGAVYSTNRGDPIRIHIVYHNAVHILTEKDLLKTNQMNYKEFEKFKESIGQEMAYAHYVTILQQSEAVLDAKSTPYSKSKNPFEDFVNNELPLKEKLKDIEPKDFEEAVFHFKRAGLTVDVIDPKGFPRNLMDQLIASQMEYAMRENKQVSILIQDNIHREFIDLDPEEIKKLTPIKKDNLYNKLCDKIKKIANPTKLAVMREEPDTIFGKFIESNPKFAHLDKKDK